MKVNQINLSLNFSSSKSLSLTFLIYKMGIVMPPDLRIKKDHEN